MKNFRETMQLPAYFAAIFTPAIAVGAGTWFAGKALTDIENPDFWDASKPLEMAESWDEVSVLIAGFFLVFATMMKMVSPAYEFSKFVAGDK